MSDRAQRFQRVVGANLVFVLTLLRQFAFGRTRAPRRAARKLRWLVLAVFAISLVSAAAFYSAPWWWPYPDDLARPAASSTLVLDRSGEPLAAFAAPDGQWRMPLAEREINPHLLDAIVAVEDARFYDHAGVDWRAAVAAAWQNATALHVRRGASTLTMQLHRLRDPRPRSFWAKLEQTVRARQIERRMPKREILVEYLNRAPFGGNLTGVGAASWRYFGKPCTSLSLSECALLAGLPQAPNRYRPDRFPERAARRRDTVLDRMLACGMISASEHAEASGEQIRASWRPLPQDVHRDGGLPALLAVSQGASPDGAGFAIPTTLDARIQRQVAGAAREHLARLSASGVSAATVVVLDTPTAECLASVSLSSDNGGGIDLARRPRSTGSVLKPFIYATAFEAGTCAPAMVLDDSPAAWPGYAPQDYDRTFRGQMTAADALAESRNIPAMVVLARTGVAHTLGILRAAGLKSLGQSSRAYGLSLAVGGAEATPMEIAAAYAGLARGGTAMPVSLARFGGDDGSPRPSAEGSDATHFLKSAACWQVLRALSDSGHTAAVCPEAARLNIAWKTGTSSGNRDAWCAAVTPRRTVVVWLGNVKGDASPALVGRDAAAPLALGLIAALDPTPATWPNPAGNDPTVATARRPARSRFAIISPAPERQILLSTDLTPDRQRVPLQCAGTSTPGDVHWFVDGEHLGAASANAPLFWTAQPGRHEIRAVAADGRAASVAVSVLGG